MIVLRRVTHLLGMFVLAAISAMLILEVTDVTNGRWRREVADGISSTAFPTWPLWVSGLVGAGLAIVGILLVASQVAPPKKGLNNMYEVYRSSSGDTRIRGRAAIRAASHELEQIEGVVDVTGRVAGKTVHLELRVDDRSNLATIENEARARLDHEFWINLGLADFAVNLLVTHHPKPPRVR